MLDQLRIGAKSSIDDFDASLAERHIVKPKKKEIKESVPFSNVTYDFTKIDGEIYWDEGELEYIFEIVADSPVLLETKKAAFSHWVMNVIQEDIFDPYIEGFHFIGTFSDMDEDDDESLEKTTVTVKFSAYPYKVANTETLYNYTLSAGVSQTVTVMNHSSHRIVPTITAGAAVTITMGGNSFSLPAGTVTDDAFMLEVGANELILKSTTECTVKVSFRKEVF